jgi:hypothetical protein
MISCIKRKENDVADALSQRPMIQSMISLKLDLRDHILSHIHEDHWYREIKFVFEKGNVVEAKYEGYSLDTNGLLRYLERMYIPKREDLLKVGVIRSSSSTLQCSSKINKDACEYENRLLLVGYEEGYNSIQCRVP